MNTAHSRSQLMSKRGKSIVLALLSFAMLYVFSYMLNPYDSWWQYYFTRTPSQIIEELAISLAICVIISLSSISIHEQLNRKYSWIERPLRRLLIETALNIGSVIMLVSGAIIVIMLIDKKSVDIDTIDKEVGILQWTMINIFIAFVISAIHTGNYLISNWKDAELEATEHKLRSTRHKQAAAEAELEALKLQLDPHFVFNNLSVLSELILEDQQLGYQYSESFAKVYRYLLLNSKRDLIPLEDEIKFLKAYIFLLQTRAGSGLHFEINIDPAHLNLHIPPMTLQLLIENAMKHNKHLKSDPLKILVASGPETDLIVSNNILPLQQKGSSSGLGLQNIIQRYQLLSERAPKITTDDSIFQVSIPLIKA